MRRTPGIRSELPDVCGTSDVSRLCGVSSTTAAHWIDQGEMPSFQTPGGHRRVLRSDLTAFLHAYHFPVLSGSKARTPTVLIIDEDPAERAQISSAVHGCCARAQILEAANIAEARTILKRVRVFK